MGAVIWQLAWVTDASRFLILLTELTNCEMCFLAADFKTSLYRSVSPLYCSNSAFATSFAHVNCIQTVTMYFVTNCVLFNCTRNEKRKQLSKGY